MFEKFTTHNRKKPFTKVEKLTPGNPSNHSQLVGYERLDPKDFKPGQAFNTRLGTGSVHATRILQKPDALGAKRVLIYRDSK